jgi:hypothetical protein
MGNDLAKVPQTQKAELMASAVRPGQIIEMIQHVHSIVKEAMTEGIESDYAVIPGTKKKTLLKPGAEKLLMGFGLAGVAHPPQINDLPNGHREVIVETEIRNLRSGEVHAVGIGSCSTMEKKYRYRPGPVEFTGQPVPQEYWTERKIELIGGPGHSTAKNPDTGQWEIVIKGAEVENPDPADQWNTVLKMASKRSMIDGVLRATASSSMFTQDMEDLAEGTEKTAGKKAPIKPPTEKPGQPATPATGAGAGTVTGAVEAIQIRKCNNGNDKFNIKVNGKVYGTFDTAISTEATQAKETGQQVTIEYGTNDKGYLEIKSLTIFQGREPGQEG